jgi:hypothetical protein
MGTITADIKSAIGPYCRQYKGTCLLLLFSLSAHFPDQDVYGSAHTHLGDAQTHLSRYEMQKGDGSGIGQT